jgi:beta-lactamase class A
MGDGHGILQKLCCSRNGAVQLWLRFAAVSRGANVRLSRGGFMLKIVIAAVLAAGSASGALAQPQPPAGQAAAQAPSPQLTRRAADVVKVLRGQADLPATFTSDFLAQVPPPQVAAVSQQLSSQFGAPQGIERIEAQSPDSATIHVGFERAVVRMSMSLEPVAPHRIAGLLVTGSDPRGGDSAQALLPELQALPGSVSFAIARLGEGAPALVAGHQPDRALAIGSAFKLIILGELSRQVKAGERRWSDVAAIDLHSFPSGILQDWPLGSPVTLHTLAALMISRSDNTATDILLRLLGRENVERMMARMGVAAAARNRPLLTTLEAFQLKLGTPERLASWQQADEAARRRLLGERLGAAGAPVDVSRISASPTAIDTVEWFASANDLVRVMDWLRANGDQTLHAIMAINSGIGPQAAGAFDYFGFKGGSEPGVINLTFLVRNKQGVWHAVTGSWNNPAAAVEDGRFLGLMSRALGLVR